jgi:hypothetical protein
VVGGALGFGLPFLAIAIVVGVPLLIARRRATRHAGA